MKTLRVAIIGMGGFAGVHHDVVARLEASGEYQLIAAWSQANSDASRT
jgi:predicted dehydrogenase